MDVNTFVFDILGFLITFFVKFTFPIMKTACIVERDSPFSIERRIAGGAEGAAV